LNGRLNEFLNVKLPHNSQDYIPDIVHDFILDYWEELKEIMEYGQ